MLLLKRYKVTLSMIFSAFLWVINMFKHFSTPRNRLHIQHDGFISCNPVKFIASNKNLQSATQKLTEHQSSHQMVNIFSRQMNMQLIKFIELCRKLAFLRSHALLWDKEKKSLYELQLLLLSLGEKKSEEKIS